MIILRPQMLGALVHGRSNNFQLLRFAGATFVVFFHCFALTNRWTEEPLWRLSHDWNFGALGVKIFFVISGFLVTKSWQQRSRLLPFMSARALRIYPALILATLFTVALAGVSTSLTWSAFLTDPITRDFVWHTASGWSLRDELPGAFVANPFPRSVNGSLWTLPVEIRLYIYVGLAGAVALIAQRWLFATAMVFAIAVTLLSPEWLQTLSIDAGSSSVVILFAIGSLAWLVRDWLPVSLPFALAAVIALLAIPVDVGRGILFAALFSYLVLAIAFHPLVQFPAFNRIGDYSYGIYVYAFPIQQTLIQRNPDWSPTTLFLTAMPLLVALAMLSWHGVEKPMLGLKSRFL